jgi:hypothetical protein
MIDEDSEVRHGAYRVEVFMLPEEAACTISTGVRTVMTLGIHTIGEYD